MSIFRRKPAPYNPEDDRDFVIQWLRNRTGKDYEKDIKVVETYRDADEKVKIIELGSKKAVKELEKEEQADMELDNNLAELMETKDGK